MPVSNLHPATNGPLPWIREALSLSDRADRGEPLHDSFTGDGERELNLSFRACWYGVDGNELE